jgi:Protein of unknwon function (DUF3310)
VSIVVRWNGHGAGAHAFREEQLVRTPGVAVQRQPALCGEMREFFGPNLVVAPDGACQPCIRRAEALEKAAAHDAVNHPSHYMPGPYEVYKVLLAWGSSWPIGSAIKYLARAGKKDPTKTVEDLRKAIKFIEFAIEDVEARSRRGDT